MPWFNITLNINVTFQSLRWSCTYLNRTLNIGTNLSVMLSMLIVVTIKYGIRNGHPESQMPGSIGPSVAWQPEYTYIKDIPEIYVLHVIKYFMQAGNIPFTVIVNLSISTFFEVKKVFECRLERWMIPMGYRVVYIYTLDLHCLSRLYIPRDKARRRSHPL